MAGLDERADAERGTRDRLGGTVLGRPCVSLRRGRRSLELYRCGPRSIAGPSPWLVAPRWGHPRRPRRSSPSSGCARSGRTSQSRSTSLPRRAGAQPRGCSPGARCSLYPPGEQQPSSSNALMNEQASKSSPTSRHDDPPPHALSGRRARAKCSALADRPASHTRSARLLRSRAVEARPGRRPPSAWKPLLLRADRTAASTCLQRRGADEDAADPRQGCPVGCGWRLLT